MIGILSTVIGLVLLEKVMCQTAGGVYKPLKVGQEFYSDAIISPGTAMSTWGVVFGGWFKVKTPSGKVDFFQDIMLDGGTINTYSIDSGLLFFKAQVNALTSTWTVQADQNWIFIAWVAEVSGGCQQGYDMFSSSIQSFCLVQLKQVLTNQNFEAASTRLNQNTSLKSSIGNIAHNRTAYFTPDVAVEKAALFYAVVSSEAELKARFFDFMVGPYKGQLNYYSGKRYNYYVPVTVYTDITRTTVVYDEFVRPFGRKLISENHHDFKLMMVSGTKLSKTDVDTVRVVQANFELYRGMALGTSEVRKIKILIYSESGGNTISELFTVIFQIDGPNSLTVKFKKNQNTDQPQPTTLITDSQRVYFSIVLRFVRKFDFIANMKAWSLQVSIQTKDLTGSATQYFYTYYIENVASGDFTGVMVSGIQTSTLKTTRCYLTELIVQNGGMSLSKDVSTFSANCGHPVILENQPSASGGCLSCYGDGKYWNQNGGCADIVSLPSFNLTCSTYLHPKSCISCTSATNRIFNPRQQYCFPSSFSACPTGSTFTSGASPADEDPANSYSTCYELIQDQMKCSIFSSLDAAGTTCSCNLVDNCNKCDQTACDVCVSGYLLEIVGGHRKCVSFSNTMQYFGKDLSNSPQDIYLKQCHASSCLSCASDFKTCQTCATGYLKVASSCIKCDLGLGRYKINSPPSDCGFCHQSCATCDGPTATDCLSCHFSSLQLNYIHPNKTCGPCDELNKYFLVTTVSPKVCESCHTSCQTCNGKLNTNCLTCPTSSFYFEDKSCDPTCQIDAGLYVLNSIYCNKCHSSCRSCTGPNPQHCTACYTGAYLHPHDGTCGPCATTNGFFIEDLQCIKCDPSCKSCTGTPSTSCTACYQTSGAKSYFNPHNNSCSFCGSEDTWSSITASYPLFQYIDTAIAGFPNCRLCSDNCRKCQVSSNYCIDCNLGDYLYPTNNCGLCNEVRFFKVEASKKCENCHPTCLTCSGADQIDCLSCDSSHYLYPNNTCILGCNTQDGWFTDGLKCIKCDSSCLTCINFFSSSCSSCRVGEFLGLNGSCTACLKNGLVRTPDGFCRPCNMECATCSIHSSNCTTCRLGLYQYPNNSCGRCRETNHYKTSENGITKCFPCDPTCLECKAGSKNDCTKCDNTGLNGQILLLFPDNSCRECNLEGWYRNGYVTCEKCHEDCATCTGSAPNQCTSCQTPRMLSKGRCIFYEVRIQETAFNALESQAEVKFDAKIRIPVDLMSKIEYAIVQGSETNTAQSIAEGLSQASSLDDYPGLAAFKLPTASLKQVAAKDNSLHLKLEATSSISQAILIVRLKHPNLITSAEDDTCTYLSRLILVPNINLVVSDFAKNLEKLQNSMSTGVSTASTLITVASLPQAFILFKVFATLDIYIFVDVDYPANFEAFFKVISKTIIDFIPGIYDWLADEEGTDLPKRFKNFGYKVHILKNLGPILTVVTGLLLLKGLTWPFRSGRLRFVGKYLKSSSRLT